MPLTKQSTVDKIEIVGEYNIVQVRTKTAVIEDGSEISAGYHRHTIAPGDDYSNESADVKAICKAVHTKAVKDAYQANLAS